MCEWALWHSNLLRMTLHGMPRHLHQACDKSVSPVTWTPWNPCYAKGSCRPMRPLAPMHEPPSLPPPPQIGRRRTPVTVLTGSIVRIWDCLERVLTRHEAELSRSDRVMRIVRVDLGDGSLPIIGESRGLCSAGRAWRRVLAAGPGRVRRGGWYRLQVWLLQYRE